MAKSPARKSSLADGIHDAHAPKETPSYSSLIQWYSLESQTLQQRRADLTDEIASQGIKSLVSIERQTTFGQSTVATPLQGQSPRAEEFERSTEPKGKAIAQFRVAAEMMLRGGRHAGLALDYRAVQPRCDVPDAKPVARALFAMTQTVV